MLTLATTKKHFTVTGYTVNPDRTKILLVHHKKLDKWLSAGGHLEENEIPHEAVMREVFEETGVRALPVIENEYNLGMKGETDSQIPRPFAMMYQIIPESSKDEEHIHLDMGYILEASETALLTAQAQEVHDVRWFSKADIAESSDVFDSVKGFAKTFLQP